MSVRTTLAGGAAPAASGAAVTLAAFDGPDPTPTCPPTR
jgi:hypothetical protein